MEALMQRTDNELSDLLGDFLRRRTTSAKDLARVIDCDPRSADGYRAGRYFPQARHLRLIVRAYGRDVLAALFDNDIDAVAARLASEARDLEMRLDVLHGQQKAFDSPLAGHPQRRAADDPDEPLGPENLDLFGGGR